MTQHERIIKYAKEYGSITPMEAFTKLGITKLSTRIGEIERSGMAKFSHNPTTAVNRYGEETRFMLYRIKEEEDGTPV